jgi:hypothetical protein
MRRKINFLPILGMGGKKIKGKSIAAVSVLVKETRQRMNMLEGESEFVNLTFAG